MIQSVSYGFYCSVCLGAACLCFLSLGMARETAGITGSELAARGSGVDSYAQRLDGNGVRVRLDRLVLPARSVAQSSDWHGDDCLLCLVVLKFDSLVGFQREGTVEDTKTSAECRGAFAIVSWQMFCDYPLFGVGFGNFPRPISHTSTRSETMTWSWS